MYDGPPCPYCDWPRERILQDVGRASDMDLLLDHMTEEHLDDFVRGELVGVPAR